MSCRVATRATTLAVVMVSMTALTTGMALADWGEEPDLEEFTEIAFEVVDIGFCTMQELGLSDAELRAGIAEAESETWLHGRATAPQETAIHGSALFKHGNAGSAMVTAMQAFLVPEERAITLLCLLMLPADNPDAVEGQFALQSFPDFTDQAHPDPSYVLLGKLIGRDAEGDDVDLAYLQDGTGNLNFIAEDDVARRQPGGADAYVALSFDGVLSDGQPIAFDVNSALFDAEHLTFMYLHTP